MAQERFQSIETGNLSVRSLAREEIKIVANGIELKHSHKRGFDKASIAYENKCFSSLLERSGDSILLGPALIDEVFGSCKLGAQVRPDAMKFNIEDNIWLLAEMFEFKSSRKEFESIKKLEGFSQLLANFRQTPDCLPELLNSSFGMHLPVPKTIKIPENENVSVIFMTPIHREMHHRATSGFRLSHRRIEKNGK